MNKRERVKIAMSGGIPDRVPVIPQICHPHAIRVLGLDFRKNIIECIRKPELVNRLHLECARMYGVDGLRVWIRSDPVDVVDDGENVWQLDESTGEKIARVDFEGGGWLVPIESKPALSTMKDVEALDIVSAESLLNSEKFKLLKTTVEDGSTEFFMIGSPGSFTFEYVTFMRGKEQALIDIMEQPEFVKCMIEKATDLAIQRSIALIKTGVDALYLGETYAGLIGPHLFQDFCVPAFQRFVRALKKYDILIYLHICGNSTEVLEMMADTGVDCIEPLDPLGGVNIADAKRRVGHRVALMGGVNTLLLAHGSLQEVVDDCQRCLQEGAPGGGYILAAGDMLPTETSKEKVEAMLEAARNFRYK